ncbi:MAG: hypothetical protein ABEI27_08235 [Halobellus sp.]|uniref:DUF7475 family protein n=1 Tax=Halobellus sp. TaxID=1979212 RepID=UPI0035D5100C
MATNTANSGALRTGSLTGLHWAGIALAAITGLLHLGLAASLLSSSLTSSLGWAFIIAGVGFLGAIVAILVDFRRRQLYLLGIPFTAGQIVAWAALNAPDFSPPGIADKIVQVLLIVVLVALYRQS